MTALRRILSHSAAPGTIVTILCLAILGAVYVWYERDLARSLKRLDEIVAAHHEAVERNNELMIAESLQCVKWGGVPVRIDTPNAAPRIHCATAESLKMRPAEVSR